MNNETAHIFIDEFGTNIYLPNSPKTTSHFVYTSIIIGESNLDKAREIRDSLSKKYKQGSPLSSKSFDKKDKNNSLQKRIDFITELANSLDFTIDVLVIDKSKISGQGLKEKEIFYKYFQSLFVSKYNKRYESYYINADKIGDEIFSSELKNFVEKYNVARDLFNQDRYFNLRDDITEEPLIQLADMICGSLGKFYSSSHYHENAEKIFSLLHTRINCETFPKFEMPQQILGAVDTETNKKIREISLNSLNINTASLKDTDLAERVLEYLLSHYKANPNRFVQTYELESYLKNFVTDIKVEKIRRIIRDLRYEGAFIISVSSQYGYKIANDLNDIYQYFNHYSNYFIPMLMKIKIINQEIANDTFNSINFIEKDENFKLFQKLLLAIETE
jgi:flagellin-specific chaperone FliS